MNAKHKKVAKPATAKEDSPPKRRQVAQEMPSFDQLPKAPTAATNEDRRASPAKRPKPSPETDEDDAAPASAQRPPADS
ncbi:MAG TPA: hypothetical protein VK550_15205 [Polyangiaceae bacterium]|nr:hypothetical protein [Polyangiaceae bacterium]